MHGTCDEISVEPCRAYGYFFLCQVRHDAVIRTNNDERARFFSKSVSIERER